MSLDKFFDPDTQDYMDVNKVGTDEEQKKEKREQRPPEPEPFISEFWMYHIEHLFIIGVIWGLVIFLIWKLY